MKYRPVFNSLASHARRAAFAGAVALIASVVIARQAAADSDASLAIESVSNRADLVSGGDVLVRATLPPGLARKHRGALFVNGERFQGELHAAPDGRGYLALVTGLAMMAIYSTTGAATGTAVRMPIGWSVMAGLGIVMIALFGHIRFVLFKRLRAAVLDSKWAAGAAALASIRVWVRANLAIGIVVVIVAAASGY